MEKQMIRLASQTQINFYVVIRNLTLEEIMGGILN